MEDRGERVGYDILTVTHWNDVVWDGDSAFRHSHPRPRDRVLERAAAYRPRRCAYHH